MGRSISVLESNADLSDPSHLLVALLASAAYYCGAILGFALTFQPVPLSVLWPPNAILLAAFLIVRPQFWKTVILAVFPAHLIIQMRTGVPVEMGLGWFISNCSEALIGAVCMRWVIGRRVHFGRLRDVIGFLVFCAFFAPFASSFLDVAFVKIFHWGTGDYWHLWRIRFVSNAVAMLIIVPPLLTWNADLLRSMRQASRLRRLEAALLALALSAIGIVTFVPLQQNPAPGPLLLYAPLPLLLWITVRFNPFFASAAFLLLALLSIWATLHGHGPFIDGAPSINALSIQFFLMGIAVPLLLLSAAIQERRQSQKSLIKKNEKLTLALLAAKIGTWEWDIQEKKGASSLELKCMFGITNENPSLQPASFLRLIHREDRAAVLRGLRQAYLKCSPFESEFRIIRPDGEAQWFFSKGAILRDNAGYPAQMLGVVIDITERKLGETMAVEQAALHESEARFRQMADDIPHIVWAARPDGYIDYANRRWHELTRGWARPAGDVAWLPFIHLDDRQQCLNRWQDAVKSGHALEIEFRLLFPNTGAYRWQLGRALPVQDEKGEIVRWYGTSTDIDDQKKAENLLQVMHDELEHRVAVRTAELSRANAILQAEIEERKRAEEAEQVSEARFAKVFRLSPDAMCISSGMDGPILDVNERWLTLFKYDRVNVIGKTAQQLHLYVDEWNLAIALKQNKEVGFVSDLDVKMRDREMGIRNTVLSGGAIVIGKEGWFITIIRDVTEQRRAELELQQQREQLTHLARFVMLGELSGALAHELNQPLAAILTNAQAAQRFLAKNPANLQEVREILNDIVDEDKRASEVIRSLRALFLRSEPKLISLDTNEVVCQAIDLARNDLIARRVVVTRQFSYGLRAVQGDRIQLQQVILNLIVNACQAMSDSVDGKRQLTFTTHSDTEGNVGIEVSDTGCGIAPELIDKVFESFFTTKAQGLGFGLSISRAIITAHGGRIEAGNNPVGGAVFRIKLPAHQGALS